MKRPGTVQHVGLETKLILLDRINLNDPPLFTDLQAAVFKLVNWGPRNLPEPQS